MQAATVIHGCYHAGLRHLTEPEVVSGQQIYGRGSVGRTAVSRPQFTVYIAQIRPLSPGRLSSVAIDNFCKDIMLLIKSFYRFCQVKAYERTSGLEIFFLQIYLEKMSSIVLK
jgi:hypothetical protein